MADMSQLECSLEIIRFSGHLFLISPGKEQMDAFGPGC